MRPFNNKLVNIYFHLIGIISKIIVGVSIYYILKFIKYYFPNLHRLELLIDFIIIVMVFITIGKVDNIARDKLRKFDT